MAKLLRVHFRCASLEDFAREHLDDIGRSSVFVRTRQRLPPDTAVRLDLRLADGRPLLAGSGTVLYSVEEEPSLALPAGIEIRLDALTPEAEATFAWLLARRARRQRLSTGSRRFRDTLPGLGAPAPAPRGVRAPARPVVREATGAGHAPISSPGDAAPRAPAVVDLGSDPSLLPVFILPACTEGERVELLGPLRRRAPAPPSPQGVRSARSSA